MERNERMRDGLFAQLPQPANLVEYRRNVAAMLEVNQKTFLREKRWGTMLGIFCVISCTAYLWFDPSSVGVSKGPWLGLMFLLIGLLEISKYYTNRCRVDLLKEIKQVQLQVLELHALMQAPKN
jgi:hypothetical protein